MSAPRSIESTGDGGSAPIGTTSAPVGLPTAVARIMNNFAIYPQREKYISVDKKIVTLYTLAT